MVVRLLRIFGIKEKSKQVTNAMPDVLQ